MKPMLAPTLDDLLTEAGASPEALDAAVDALRQGSGDTLPWYIRAATGFGAWVAACFLLGFLGLTGLFRQEGVNFVFGVGLLGVAVKLSMFERAGEFGRQLALVLGLAGQGFLLVSLEMLHLEVVPLALCAAAQAALLFFLHRDPVHRFLCAGGALVACLAAAGLEHRAVAGECVLLVALAAVVGLGMLPVHRWPANRAVLIPPARFGLLLTCLATLSLSLGPELRNAWMTPLTSLGLTGLLGVQMFRDMAELGAAPARRLLLLPILLVVGYVSLSAPGVAAALLVLGLALRERDTLLLLVGVVFLGVFLSGFYMELALPLWHKAGLLCGSGLFAWGARWLVLRLMPAEVAR